MAVYKANVNDLGQYPGNSVATPIEILYASQNLHSAQGKLQPKIFRDVIQLIFGSAKSNSAQQLAYHSQMTDKDTPFITTIPPLTHPAYRADIDGLRAIAVLAVVGFHALPAWLTGGFVGVDIFFVISGFLISTIIFNNLEHNSFSFLEFYMRRIKRIFPALLLVLVCSFSFGWLTLLANEYKQLGKHIVASAGFVSNFVLWKESGYFDNVAITKPLLHLWSLGVEEQFYIFWPILLWAAWKKRLNLLTVTAIVAVISFYSNIIGTKENPVAAFYSPQTRFWELLVGSMLAWSTLHKPPALSQFLNKLNCWCGSIIYARLPERNNRTLSNVQSWLGAAFIGIAMLKITKENSFPGWWAVLPTLGAALIISAGADAWFNRRVLSNRLLVWFGLISFPLYLWHWPLLSFATILEGEIPSLKIRMTAVAIAILLAWLTYKFIEKPMRNGTNGIAKTTVLIFLMLLTAYIGYNCYKRDGLGFRFSEFQKISNAQGEWDFPGRMTNVEMEGVKVYLQESQLTEKTLFLGDSNLEQYYPRIEALIKRYPTKTNSAIFLSEGGCLPMPDTASKILPHCNTMMSDSLKLTLGRADITRVVIAAQWYGYLFTQKQGARFKKNEEDLPIAVGSEGYNKALSAFSDYIGILIAQHKTVILVLNIPVGAQLNPAFIAKRSLKDFPSVFQIRSGGLRLSEFEQSFIKIKTDLINVAQHHKIKIIDPVTFLCRDDICKSVSAENEPIFKDNGHLRPSFVREKASFMDSTILQQ